MYDYVIIGGGPAGLYCAKRIEEEVTSRKLPSPKILVLEKERNIGGRTRTVQFHDRTINTGAGVGRFAKDKILKKLVKQVMGTIRAWTSRICYDFENPIDVVSIVDQLKQHPRLDQIRRHETFRQFFLKNHARSVYNRFCWTNGYTDFENADVVDTLFDYGFEDNVAGTKLFYVPWNQIMKHLASRLQHTTIKRCQRMTMYTYNAKSSRWNVNVQSTISGRRWSVETSTLIIAGFLDPRLGLGKDIGTNSFLRFYTYGKKRAYPKCLEEGKAMYRKDKFQKTIPITKTLEMTSYSDNENAERMRGYITRTVSKTAAPTSYRMFYWKAGTHYFKPLRKKWASRDAFMEYAQNPRPHLFVVGEMVSHNQGWTEGAFESVETILDKLLSCIHQKQPSELPGKR